MATEPAKKPTSRKTPAKRGPTKAAALKALGLTKEDLEILAKAKEPSETALDDILSYEAPPEEVQTPFNGRDTELADTIHRLVQGVPEEETAKVSKSIAIYARNAMYSPFRFKTESGKQYNLAPRGYRGDFKVVHKDDLEDSNILDNANRGLIELLSREEADQVITKQHTNATSSDHLRSFLRTPTGGEYAPEAFTTASEEEVQGITLASTQELDKLQTNGKGAVNWNEVHNPTAQVNSNDPYAGMTEDQRLAEIDRVTREGGNPLAGLTVKIG